MPSRRNSTSTRSCGRQTAMTTASIYCGSITRRRRITGKAKGLVVDVIVAADAAGPPIAFGVDLAAIEAAFQQGMPLLADVAGLADHDRMALARRQREEAEGVEHQIARPWRRPVARQPLQLEIGLSRDLLLVGVAADFDEGESRRRFRQRLDQREDRRNAGLVAEH